MRETPVLFGGIIKLSLLTLYFQAITMVSRGVSDKMSAPLNSRHQEILNSVVRAYIETGEPVASRTISKRRTNTLSPASIRNVMADLADEGYLSQPHTSAGRVPTEKAFRHYVSSLTASRVASAESERLRSEMSGLHTVGARVEHSSHVLVE